MSRNWVRWTAVGAGLLLGAVGSVLSRWKHRRLADLAAGSELVTTDRGVVEVARRGSGSPVLVLHGDPGGYDQGLHVGDALFGRDFEVIAPSRPGYLRTPLDHNGSFEAQAELLVALLDELDVEQAVVVGLSGGGPTALQLAAEYPERVSGLLLASAITTEIDERLFDTGNPFVDPLLTSTPVLDVQSGVFALFHRFAPDRALEQLHEDLSNLEGEEFDAYVDAIVTNPRYREQSLAFFSTILPIGARIEGTLNDERWFRELPRISYERIECPTLVVHGEYDGAVPIEHAEFAAESIPNAELLRLEADHAAWIGPGSEDAWQAVDQFTESSIAASERRTA
ncbi:alpha/beta fold hydrolase [Haloferax sp. MBLA0076]|uniref:Alpha/beta fold hydrolase n=1 Tax=Haloferax litoreum TaxID=2666140 RepID=A0A6A8GGB5_9EURY|nr:MULTISPECIES: alpha/beta hydrolase [Haloferax]KAB1192385.1 alpha/beta hydrolase [Haloferax sp. CBA1148]MRX20850.1 alpha/beta fold hydrolase [Haloferax litoreum]